MSKRKKSTLASPPNEVVAGAETDSVTMRAAIPPEILEQTAAEASAAEPTGAPAVADATGRAPEADTSDEPDGEAPFDAELTVNLVGELPGPGRDDLDAPTVTASGEALGALDAVLEQRRHLRGLLEALVFASDSPIATKELAKLAHAPPKQVKELLEELEIDYASRGVHLDEVAGGWVFRTSPKYALFVRDLTKQKPVRLTRAQVETLAIIAYRQPITRPEVDDVRGVDSGPVLKLLLERDLVRILGKRDEVGRPLIYGTTGQFLEFFGLKSLKDLPTLREFTELSDESREAFEDELGEDAERDAAQAEARGEEDAGLGAHEAAPDRARRDDDVGYESDEDDDDLDGAPLDGTTLDDDAIGRAVRDSMRVPGDDDSSSDLTPESDDDEPPDDRA